MPRYARCLILLLAAVSTGCAWNAQGPCTIPLVLKNQRTGKPIESAVIVSLVRSTGWFPYIQMESRSHPFDELRIEKIAVVDSANPSALMPHHVAAGGFILALIVNEDPEILVFSPGYEPGGMIDVLLNGKPTRWGYTQSAYEKNAVVKITMTPLLESPDAASRLLKTHESDTPHSLLIDKALWDEFRGWYFWGRNRAEIKLICKTVLADAQAFLIEHPKHKWSAREQETLEWCRRITGDAP